MPACGNSVVFFSFVAAFVLMWVLPWFWLGAFLMVAAYAGPLAGYVVVRNRAVSLSNGGFSRPIIFGLCCRKRRRCWE